MDQTKAGTSYKSPFRRSCFNSAAMQVEPLDYSEQHVINSQREEEHLGTWKQLHEVFNRLRVFIFGFHSPNHKYQPEES
jgi:hypothetical protein